MRCRALPSLFLAAMVVGGCAPLSHVEGADQVSEPPATAGLVAHGCTTRDGRSVEAPVARYYPEAGRRRPLLYEMTPNGRGMRIVNGWSDSLGTHFFAWVPSGPGYHYVFPSDPSLAPFREVLGPGYRIQRHGGSFRFGGSGLIRCALRPITNGEWSG